jgi:cation:H+ antiporter
MINIAVPTSWANEWPVFGLLLGFVCLIGGANLLVRGAVWMALTLGMSRLTVGLTLVAFGTSAPELLVSLTSALQEENELAISNVLGSNNMNVLLIIGVTALIRPIHLRVDRMELAHMLFATGLLTLPFLFGFGITRPLAALMLTHLLVFCVLLLRRERRGNVHTISETKERRAAGAMAWVTNIATAVLGLALLTKGAEWLIEGAKVAAESLGMSKALIGATIVAGGTSLPELATSALAARKGHPEIAIGNVLGSNIFNVGSVLGVCGLIHPFPIAHSELTTVLWFAVGSAIWLAVLLRVNSGVGRRAGLLFMLAMCAYIVTDVWRSQAS